MLQTILHDAALAWRGLIRRPFYPAATIIMLALALAANAVSFGIFYGYELKPLPYAHSSRIFFIAQFTPKFGKEYSMASPNAYRAIVGSGQMVEDAGLWNYGGSAVATIGNKPREVDFSSVTPSFFTTLGTRPILGRLPSHASGEPGGPPEAMISHQFWQGAYNGKPNVLGQSIPVNGTNYQIVGVLPPDFGFSNPTDLWTSSAPPTGALLGSNVNNFVLVRLTPGFSETNFDNRLRALLPQIEQQDSPDDALQIARAGGEVLEARPMRPVILAESNIGDIPILLQGTALFLLLLAVANAANLALVRNRARLTDFALRRVLGAGLAALLRLFLLENVPILLGAAVCGAALGWLILQILSSSYQTVFSNPPLNLETGWPVYAFELAAAVLAVLIIVLVPVWQISTQALNGSVSQGSRSTLSKASKRTQTGLGSLQVGLATALLAGSAMLSFSFYLMLTQPLGFQPQGRFVASVLFPSGSNSPASLAEAVTAVGNLPMTKAAGGTAFGAYPFSSYNGNITLSRTAPSAPPVVTAFVPMTFGFFNTMGITIDRGQDFNQTAFSGAGANEVIVSPDLATALFGRTDVVGQMIKLLNTDYRIIGVTGRVLWRPTASQGVHGVAFFPAPTITAALLQFALFGGATVIGNMAGAAQQSAQAMQTAIEHAVPGCVVTSVVSYGNVINSYNGFRAVAAGLVAGFALLALVLAGFGVFAVNAFIARARLPEFGMRAMLGASPGRLLRLALTDAAWLLGFGLGGGLVGGYLLVRAMSSLLFNADGAELPVFLISVVVIAAIVLVSAWRPASRAANTPVKTLLSAT
jgi:predicted permease